MTNNNNDAHLKVGVQVKLVVVLDTDPGLGVFTDTLFEKVGLALERDHFHPLKGVLDLVVLGAVQSLQETVGAEFNVLAHETRIHANQFNGESVLNKFLFNLDGIANDFGDTFGGQLVDQLGVQEAGKVAVQAFVTGDQLIGEAKTGHETTLLEPENGAKGPRKENAFDGRKGDATFGKRGVFGCTPLQGPVGLLLDARYRFDGGQETVLFGGITNVGVNQERVGFGVNVLNGNLETVKATGFGGLDFGGKVLGQVFVDDTVGSGEKGQDVRDKVTFVAGETFPILQVRGQVDFLGCPKTGFGLFVHLPNLHR